MDRKKKTIKKIVMSRRFLPVSKLVDETKLCCTNLLHLQQKRQQLLNQLRILQNLKTTLAPEILIRKKEQTQNFWEDECQLMNEDAFKSNFRMSRSLFYKLCELLAGVRKSVTSLYYDMSLEKRVAIALFVLGSSAKYHTVANMFGVKKENVQKILLSFCDDVWKVLAPVYLNNFPLKKEKVKNLVNEFEELGFPQCMGALGCLHVEFNPSEVDPISYYNSKGWYSIVLLSLVDARCRFIYVSSGSPGRRNGSQIFESSSLKQYLDQCTILDDLKKSIANVNVPVFMIGDSNFQLSDKLMKPYSSDPQLRQQKQFNNVLSRSYEVVENTFRQLKARFIRIGIGIDTTSPIEYANAIILSCCALHNFLSINNDTINMNWLIDLRNVEGNRLYPQHSSLLTYNFIIAEKMRLAISSYLCSVEGEYISGALYAGGESARVEGDVSGEDAGIDGDGSREDEVIGEVTVGNNGWYIIDEFIS